MPALRMFTAILLCCLLPVATFAAESQVGYGVIYSGGSLPDVKGGEELKLYLDAKQVRLRHKSQDVVVIPANAITEVSYGQEVHRRIGTAAGLAVVSLGIGALVAFSKSKKHYIGITWADAGNKGGVVLQADKNEYRGLLTALEGVSGKAAVDTDSPRQAATPTWHHAASRPPPPHRLRPSLSLSPLHKPRLRRQLPYPRNPSPCRKLKLLPSIRPCHNQILRAHRGSVYLDSSQR